MMLILANTQSDEAANSVASIAKSLLELERYKTEAHRFQVLSQLPKLEQSTNLAAYLDAYHHQAFDILRLSEKEAILATNKVFS